MRTSGAARTERFEHLMRRRNLFEAIHETWRPPALMPSSGLMGRLSWALRRYFDLQCGSIWRDMSILLNDAHGTVLDVGCGAQPYRSLVPLNCRYVAIDHTHASEFGYHAPDTKYYSGQIWPMEDESADVIIATETLEHVPDPSVFLNEARRCLRPDGTFIATVPFAARWHFIPFDYWRFTPSGLGVLLKQAGFKQIHVFARGGAFTVACYKIMTLLLRLLAPQSRTLRSWIMRACAVPLLPVLCAVAILANTSLYNDDSDDCLGYTVVAQ